MLISLPISKREFDEIAIDLDVSGSDAGPELVASFTKKAAGIRFTKDEVLFRIGEPGNSVYLVQSGEIGLVLPIDRTRGIGFRAKPGSLVGLPAAFSKEPYSMTAIAWGRSEVLVMSADRFSELVAASPTLVLDVLRILAAETRAARVAVVETGAKRRDAVCR